MAGAYAAIVAGFAAVIDTNPVEKQTRLIALTRKNALFAGHEVGAENWAMLASLIATCKMSDVNPVDHLADTLRAILDGHPKSRIENPCPGRRHTRQASPHDTPTSRLHNENHPTRG